MRLPLAGPVSLYLVFLLSVHSVSADFLITPAVSTGNRFIFDFREHFVNVNEVVLGSTANSLLKVLSKTSHRSYSESLAPAIEIIDSKTLRGIQIEEGNHNALNKTIQLTGDAIVRFTLLPDTKVEKYFELFLKFDSPPRCFDSGWYAMAVGGPSCPCDDLKNCISDQDFKRSCASYTCTYPTSAAVDHISDLGFFSSSSGGVIGVHGVLLICMCVCVAAATKRKAEKSDVIHRIMSGLPVVEPSPDAVCSICLESAEEGEGQDETPVWVSLECSHTFHKACIMTWLLRADPPSCPVCREPVLAVSPPTENSPDNG